MQPVLMQTLRSRWLAVSLHLAFWLLLYLCVRKLGGKGPEFHDANSAFLPTQAVAPVASLERLFQPTQPALVLASNAPDLFTTAFFVPPPTPAPPPPPTTKKVPVVYQGFYVTATGPKSAILKMPEGFRMISVGQSVLTNIFVADPGMQLLVLTNQAGQTNLLPLNTQKELEVPVK